MKLNKTFIIYSSYFFEYLVFTFNQNIRVWVVKPAKFRFDFKKLHFVQLAPARLCKVKFKDLEFILKAWICHKFILKTLYKFIKMPRGKFTLNIYTQHVQKFWNTFWFFEKSNFADMPLWQYKILNVNTYQIIFACKWIPFCDKVGFFMDCKMNNTYLASLQI